MYSTKSLRPAALAAASATTLTFQVVGSGLTLACAVALGAATNRAATSPTIPAKPVIRLIIASFSLAASRHASAGIDVQFVALEGQFFVKLCPRSAETAHLPPRP